MNNSQELQNLEEVIKILDKDIITYEELEEVFSAFYEVIAETKKFLENKIDGVVTDTKAEGNTAIKELAYNLTDIELSLKDLVNSSERASLSKIKELSQRFSSEIQRLESSIPEAQDISSLEIKIRNIEDSITTPDNAVQIADKINTLHEYIKPEVIIGWDEINKKINKGSLPKDFDVRIGVSKTELRRVEDRVTVLEGSSGGTGWTIETPTGTLYNQDTGTDGLIFTSTATATAVFVDGATYFDGCGCTISGTTITLDNPATQFIRVAI